jgi:antibiotic biosynthesis monooxygenase (ABM) superfamily enzyme
MVKGIIGYKVVDYRDLEPILRQLRLCATRYPGFVDAEFLVSDGDHSVGVMISTWQMMENWRVWVGSKATQELLWRARTVVTGTPRITAYTAMPTVE